MMATSKAIRGRPHYGRASQMLSHGYPWDINIPVIENPVVKPDSITR